MKLIKIQNQLKSSGLTVFTTREFTRVTRMSFTASRKFLLRYTELGIFWQLRRGYYTFREPPVHAWIIAHKLYQPSYISMESALSHYGFIPESVYGVTSVTTRLTREFQANNTLFIYQTMKKEAYRGYRPHMIDGQTVFLAEPEKVLADYFYFVHLGKKNWNDRIRIQDIHQKKLWDYLKCFERKNLLSWSRDAIADKL